ncbi:hypothetical protein BC936DRAFT_137448 [Jimgerdemannia flammicorona]|uniref:Uncharacterized protein n=1 Tax=Jimgerdemannia flammicorona TaxID=994334 RepID=A0A433CXB8_9FUNG|nr:hypothetical protein BC936DRAFT_137448 [Jimgerdemannia flammicorona]
MAQSSHDHVNAMFIARRLTPSIPPRPSVHHQPACKDMKRYGGPPPHYRQDYQPVQRYYKKPRLPPTKPSRKSFFDFRLSKIIIGSYVAETESAKADDENKEMRLRFYLRHDADADSRPDGIAITLEGGAARYLVGADHIESIRLTQKDGRFEVVMLNGVFQVLVLDGAWHNAGSMWVFRGCVMDVPCSWLSAPRDEQCSLAMTLLTYLHYSNPVLPLTSFSVLILETERLENAAFVPSTDDPSGGQLAEARRLELIVDMDHPVTQPKWTKENIEEWTNESSRFRSILEVIDAEAPKSLDDVFDNWARTSTIGLLSDRLLFAKVQLPRLERLFEIVTRLVRKESSLGPAIDGLLALVRQLADRAPPLSREELEKLIRPVVMAIPEYLVLRAVDGMWKNEARDG